MQLVRTTIRIQQPLKKAAEKKAQELDISFQLLLTKALEQYLAQKSKVKAQSIVFDDKNIGVALDNLSREDIYAD